jgi:hypothetical protein
MPPENDLLTAVTAAVNGETPPAADPPAQDPPASDPPAGDPSAPSSADLIGDPPPDPAAPAPEPVADASGRLRDPVTKKFVAKDPEKGGETQDSTKKPQEPAVQPPAEPPKATDPLNDPVPANARPETKERITTLANMVKEERTQRETLNTELAQTRADFDLLMNPITEAGASLEQFNESMTLLKLINSPHQHEQMQALEYLQGAASQLAERLGQVPPGADPLAGFPDLQAQVQQNPAMRKMAEEAARGRRFQASTQQFQQAQQRQTQQTQAQQRAIQEGQSAVREVEEGFKAIDPQYTAKVALLRADKPFMDNMRKMPPAQWAVEFSRKYRTLKVAAAPAPAAAAPAAGAPSPLRAKTPAGGHTKPPASALEAVQRAVGAA